MIAPPAARARARRATLRSSDATPAPTRLCIVRMNIAQHVDRRQRDAGERDHRDRELGVEERRAGSGTRRRSWPSPASPASPARRSGTAPRAPARGTHAAHSRMSSDPVRSASSTMMKNSGATTRPWLTICSSAPCAPSASRQGEDPERDEAELRHRRVAEDQPRVGLRERLRRAVEDRQQREHQ